MKKLLVIDSEPAVPAQFFSVLGSTDWVVEGATSAAEAHAALNASSFDVVFANIHLAGAGGIQLLAEIKHRFPHTIRIAMSGAAHQTMILRALEVAHQFLPKPIAPEGLKAALARSGSLQPQPASESLRRLITDLRTLPSLPDIYQELVVELQSPRSSIETAARIISRDMAMVSKILQVVNSAYFNLRRTISSPAHALALLGIDTVKSLVLSLQVFSQFTESTTLPLSIEELWRHGVAAGSSARAIANTERMGKIGVEGAFIAGLVHDLGVLVLATNFPDRYADVLHASQQDHLPPWKIEQEAFGATHSDVAGYLLGIWGLSDAVVEAVTYHHQPSLRPHTDMTVLAAVHVANAFDEERSAALATEERTPFDLGYLSSCGVIEHFSRWRECHRAG